MFISVVVYTEVDMAVLWRQTCRLSGCVQKLEMSYLFRLDSFLDLFHFIFDGEMLE